jgi:histone-lysine N-methyltransferase SETD1
MLQQFCTINDATLHEDKISSGPFGENTQTRGRKKNDGFDSSPVERQKKRPKIVDCSAKYLGDGNDIESQQEANWRWQSTRYNPYTSLKTLPLKFGFLSCLLSRFVGEVVRIQPGDSDSKTLAVVTCKRLILPEHTEWGRSSSHLPNEIYEDFDSFSAANGVIATNDKSQQPISYFCFPIEDLVTVSRQLDNILTTKAQNVILRHKLILTRAYSLRVNMFADVQNSGINTVDIKTQLCCRCRKPRNKGGQKTSNGRSLCYTCFYALKIMVPEGTRQNNKSKITCECRQCKRNVEPEKEMQFFKSVSRASERKKHLPSEKLQQKLLNNTTEFMSTCATLECMNNVDFHILDDLLPRMVPSSKPVMRVKKKSSKKSEKSSNSYSLATSHGERETSSLRSLYKHQYLMQAKEQVPETCCRAFPYNNQTRKLDIFKKRNIQCQHAYLESKDRKRNLRSLIREGTASYLDYKKKQGGIYDSRRLRANQRRLLRDVAAMGVSLDTLAGREQHLRFDRSKIHAWGVFADIDIRENEMLVEYRGEIIGNSMSEKREKEYENAKIGSDYMFRVDDFSVCDATKQGNVARFINHSCGPNCFTKIISIEGVKRIVLYAKRDIVAGEELSYDYKFPLEYNEKKRISCHCGSHDCRGYMNWVRF